MKSKYFQGYITYIDYCVQSMQIRGSLIKDLKWKQMKYLTV